MGVFDNNEVNNRSEQAIEAKATNPDLHHFAMERTSPDLEMLMKANQVAIKQCVDSMVNAVKALPADVRSLLMAGFTPAQESEPLYAAIISANRSA